MKKKTLTIFVSLLVAMVCCYLSYAGSITMDKYSLDALQLANIDALASSDEAPGTEVPCYNTITKHTGSKVRYCGTCDWVDESTDAWYSFQKKCTVK